MTCAFSALTPFISETMPCNRSIHGSYLEDMDDRRIDHASINFSSSQHTSLMVPMVYDEAGNKWGVPLQKTWCSASLVISSGRSCTCSGITSFVDDPSSEGWDTTMPNNFIYQLQQYWWSTHCRNLWRHAKLRLGHISRLSIICSVIGWYKDAPKEKSLHPPNNASGS